VVSPGRKIGKVFAALLRKPLLYPQAVTSRLEDLTSQSQREGSGLLKLRPFTNWILSGIVALLKMTTPFLG
jgi:hypothetical protein